MVLPTGIEPATSSLPKTLPAFGKSLRRLDFLTLHRPAEGALCHYCAADRQWRHVGHGGPQDRVVEVLVAVQTRARAPAGPGLQRLRVLATREAMARQRMPAPVRRAGEQLRGPQLQLGRHVGL